MSLTVGLQLPVELKLAGIVVLSGYLPGAKKFRLTDGLQDIPIFHGHGDSDPMVHNSSMI
jgi:predicted esterase